MTTLFILALAACGPAAEPPPPAAPPPAVSDFGQPMTARGNEPFWAVRIEGTRLTLLRPDHSEAVFKAPGAAIGPGRASWTATAPDGRTLTVTLYVSNCSDGMSDLRYPMTAEVSVNGEVLHGCAAKTAELPREGGG